MMAQMNGPYGPFAQAYIQFWKQKDQYKGYEFGKAPNIKTPPPVVRFDKPLRWWSIDRPQRLRAIRQVRDRYLMDILELGRSGQVGICPDSLCDKTRRTAGNRIKGSQEGTTFQLIQTRSSRGGRRAA